MEAIKGNKIKTGMKRRIKANSNKEERSNNAFGSEQDSSQRHDCVDRYFTVKTLWAWRRI
jgi:hypothetical protein